MMNANLLSQANNPGDFRGKKITKPPASHIPVPQSKTQSQNNSKYNTNIKEMLNTSAPLCISSYIQNNEGSNGKRAPAMINSMSRISSNYKQSSLPQSTVQQNANHLNLTTVLHSNQSQEDLNGSKMMMTQNGIPTLLGTTTMVGSLLNYTSGNNTAGPATNQNINRPMSQNN